MLLETIGYAVCHQIEERCLVFGEQVMPLCARCTGVYLGFIVSVIALILLAGEKKRGVKLPATPYLVILLAFMLIMAFDVFAQSRGLYLRNNQLSLFTGLLMGLSLANLILPVFNFTFWQRNDTIPLLDGRRFAWLLGIMVLVFFGTIYLGLLLYWPLAAASIMGLIALYLSINSLVYMIVFKKENLGQTVKNMIPLSSIALAMTSVELYLIATIRF